VSMLDDLHAEQHMDRKYQSDEQLEWFLAEAEANPDAVLHDLLPRSEVELQHLAQVRRAA
jgi:hypothetical protein